MNKSYYSAIIVAFIITVLTAPVFGQNNSEEARKYMVRGMAAIEMANDNEGLEAAAAEFGKAINIDPYLAAAWYNLGSVQSKLGHLNEAIKCYRRYLVLAPEASDARQVSDELIKLEYKMEKEEARILKRDGRFIAYVDGTVLDTKTKLMWAANDNGSDMRWTDARSYCENYRGGGYMDWRMPNHGELVSLYDAGKTYESNCGSEVHITELIHLSCRMYWSAETYVSGGTDMANVFSFDGSSRGGCDQNGCFGRQMALPVRSAK
jgi:tetratricopeptide (TPR) repeat protein